MASRGHRVIACAQKLLPGDEFPVDHQFSSKEYPETKYCFVGLVSLEDPPKHGVREAIGTLRLAGIKVMMVTGTNPPFCYVTVDVGHTGLYRRPSEDCRSYCAQNQSNYRRH